MKVTDFRFFEYFNPNENWGDIAILEWEHIFFLNLIRRELSKNGYDWAFHVNCSVDFNGHSKNSYHYVGKATDGYFNTNRKS